MLKRYQLSLVSIYLLMIMNCSALVPANNKFIEAIKSLRKRATECVPEIPKSTISKGITSLGVALLVIGIALKHTSKQSSKDETLKSKSVKEQAQDLTKTENSEQKQSGHKQEEQPNDEQPKVRRAPTKSLPPLPNQPPKVTHATTWDEKRNLVEIQLQFAPTQRLTSQRLTKEKPRGSKRSQRSTKQESTVVEKSQKKQPVTPKEQNAANPGLLDNTASKSKPKQANKRPPTKRK